ncbi:hypothetical protein C2869_04950 [Saccharobesus litoralis]|uniref:Uncharacterized protein n=1 Tax=Saccharobesus litoralis TaxID=2172099 RepID=A0A2S0VNM8_9ALTE|nr:hypothetical protein [Saccharobesus litoralis]AWB65827.1 hypothetical protein C2869_04950 [Saccharobesus litoralis]
MFTLKNTLLANATSCILFGLAFVIWPLSIANWLSATSPAPELILQMVGAILVLNGAHLLWAASRQKPNSLLVKYFAIGDFSWVVATGGLISLGVAVTSSAGVILALLVALVVGMFGILQWRFSACTDN